MSSNRSPRRAFAVVLLAVFVFAGLPAQAQPPPREVAVLGENGLARLWSLFVDLWQRGTAKEGMSIDPDGGKSDPGTPTSASEAAGDEGVTIDPNGKP